MHIRDIFRITKYLKNHLVCACNTFQENLLRFRQWKIKGYMKKFTVRSFVSANVVGLNEREKKNRNNRNEIGRQDSTSASDDIFLAARSHLSVGNDRACAYVLQTLRYVLEGNLEARIPDFLSSRRIHLRCAVAYARNAAADR